MEELIENVLQFKQNDEFYFKLGNDLLKKGDFFGAVKYLLKSLSLLEKKNNVVKSSFCLLLGEAYTNLNNIELSNYYYYCALDIDFFSQIVYRALAENFIKKNDIILARFYLNKCLNVLEGTRAYESALARLETLKKNKPKFEVIRLDEDLFTEKAVVKAEKFMSQGKFEKVVETLENNGNFSDSRVRAEICLAYFFLNENKKCIEIIENYGNEVNVLDLCNLCLIYYCEEDKENLNKTIAKIKNLKHITPEENFKIGLTLAQINELEKAKNYMKVFLNNTKNVEIEFQFLYCIVCINNCDFEEARKILIDLKVLNPFYNYVLDYYIKICVEKKLENKLDYLFNLPLSEFIKVQDDLRKYTKLNEEELLKVFKQNKDEFYYVISLPQNDLQKEILTKLANIEDDEITNFFKYYFLNNFARTQTKIDLALKRFSISTTKPISLVRDDVFIKVTVPNMKITKANNESLFNGSLQAIKYFLQPSAITQVDLRKTIIMLEKLLKDNQEDFNVIASVIVYLISKNEDRVSVAKICKYFNVTQEEFYAFINKYNIEV